MVAEVEYLGTIWFVESNTFGLLGFSVSCGRFWNGDRSWGVGLSKEGLNMRTFFLGC